MKTKGKKRFLPDVPAWGLAALTAILLFFVLMFGASLLGSLKFMNGDTGEATAYIVYGILTAVACFFICRRYPKSYWYVPLICNIVTIIAAFVEPNFCTTSMWILFSVGWVLSIIGTIVGTLVGRGRVSI
jgi:hypothetical protein